MRLSDRQGTAPRPVHSHLLWVLSESSVFFHFLLGHLLQGGVACYDMIWSSASAVAIQACSDPILTPFLRWECYLPTCCFTRFWSPISIACKFIGEVCGGVLWGAFLLLLPGQEMTPGCTDRGTRLFNSLCTSLTTGRRGGVGCSIYYTLL